jgi:hypothetical protein
MQEKASSNRNPQMKASINKESTVKSVHWSRELLGGHIYEQHLNIWTGTPGQVGKQGWGGLVNIMPRLKPRDKSKEN